MAIIQCKSCKKSMSSNDKKCPHCGAEAEIEMCCPKCGSNECTLAKYTQKVYICKQCDCRYTYNNGIVEEKVQPSPSEIKKYNIFTAYISMMKKTFQFRGRSSRSEYWYCALLMVALYVAVYFGVFATFFTLEVTYAFVVFFSALAIFVHTPAFIALSVRRMHDVGKSGGYLLLTSFFPIVGAILILINLCQDSDFGDNEYGPNPKGLQ